jgi:hypothetical protein
MRRTLFHEDWWLDAVCPGAWAEVEIKTDGVRTGYWRYTEAKRLGFRYSVLPPFTRFLDPVLTALPGTPSHRVLERALAPLVEAMPRFEYFQTGLGPGWDDVLVFMRNEYGVRVHQTLVVDGSKGADAAFAGISKRTQTYLRRAKERLSVVASPDPERFIAFYDANLRRRSEKNVLDFKTFAPLATACQDRGAGQILFAVGADGEPLAATFCVWDDHRTYKLLDTSHPEGGAQAAALLWWVCMEDACRRGQPFDFDGIVTEGRLKFLSLFGGRAENRFLIDKGFPLHRLGGIIKERLARSLHRRKPFMGEPSHD